MSPLTVLQDVVRFFHLGLTVDFAQPFVRALNWLALGLLALGVWASFHLTGPLNTSASPLPPRSPAPAPVIPPPRPADHEDGYAVAGYDRQMLYEEIRHRFSHDDLQDLMFDLDVNELDVVVPGQTNDELIIRVMDAADDSGQTGAVALAVERILTPPPPEYLPRPEKLSVESPRTVIRHYLLAHYSVEQLQQLAADLGIDWEQLDAGTKKDKTRALLLYLYRRNRLADLLHAIQARE